MNGTINASLMSPESRPGWHYHSDSDTDSYYISDLLRIEFYDNRKQHMLLLAVPHWIGSAALLICASAPWMPRRFRLRTLLIVTTLIALLFGLMFHASRID
jgi:hypothetical protein